MGEQGRLRNQGGALVDAGRILSTMQTNLGNINAANLKRAHALVQSGKTRGKIVLSGLTTIQSHFGPQEAIDRLETEIKAHGMGVFARINHAALAAEAGLMLRATEVILFGNPRGGTPLMQASQTIGLDLPLKALVWQDATGKTWLSYNGPAWLAKRHGVAAAENALGKMILALADLAAKATQAAPI
jgi:uncharacterized protein (DUF302 family)